MSCKNLQDLRSALKGIKVESDSVKITDKQWLKKDMGVLVDHIILSRDEKRRNECFWIVWNVAQQLGIYPASIQSFYETRGKSKIKGFTVPAMNLRTFTYETASAIFKVAKKYNAGAFIFEIAKSEIGYTGQRPSEYASLILAAAVAQGYTGGVFIQGDHFQVKASEYKKDPQKEVGKLKDLIEEAVGAGFYNIDIDSSTLVDLSKEDLLEQQRLNFEVCGLFTKFIRSIQPANLEISVGGEIGEVGKKNSTPEELRAFMKGYLEYVQNLCPISKMSVQTGSSHGGVVLPDGSLAKVKIDFDTLKEISEVARVDFNMAGAVQHGASTLPPEAFHKFPEVETAEVHLATQFQNIVYDNLPLPLKEKIYGWLKQNLSDEKKTDDTEGQFIYKTRKKALGPFKRELFCLSTDIKQNVASKLEEEFDFLFRQLKVENTKDLVDKFVKPVSIVKKREDFQDLKDLGSLEGAD